MKRVQKLLRWLPVLVFALYVLVTVGLKDRSRMGGDDIVIRPQAAANCEKLCERLAACALMKFGDTEANRIYVPQLKTSCYSGCVRQESKVMKCFQIDAPCFNQVNCVVHFLQH